MEEAREEAGLPSASQHYYTLTSRYIYSCLMEGRPYGAALWEDREAGTAGRERYSTRRLHPCRLSQPTQRPSESFLRLGPAMAVRLWNNLGFWALTPDNPSSPLSSKGIFSSALPRLIKDSNLPADAFLL